MGDSSITQQSPQNAPLRHARTGLALRVTTNGQHIIGGIHPPRALFTRNGLYTLYTRYPKSGVPLPTYYTKPIGLLTTNYPPIIMAGNAGRVQKGILASLRIRPYQTTYDLMESTGFSQNSTYRALRGLEQRGLAIRYRGTTPAIWHLAHHLTPYLYTCGHYHSLPTDASGSCHLMSMVTKACPTCKMHWPTEDRAAACCRAPRIKKSRKAKARRWNQ